MSRTENKFKLFQVIFALAALSTVGTFAWAGEQPKLILQITVDALRGDHCLPMSDMHTKAVIQNSAIPTALDRSRHEHDTTC